MRNFFLNNCIKCQFNFFMPSCKTAVILLVQQNNVLVKRIKTIVGYKEVNFLFVKIRISLQTFLNLSLQLSLVNDIFLYKENLTHRK